MARQPITEKLFQGGWVRDQSVLYNLPDFAAAIGRCATAWTGVDHESAGLLRVLLDSKSDPVVALYNSLINERAKREAINAIAKYTLPDRYQAIYESLMKARTSLAKERADIIHGIYFQLLADSGIIGWANSTAIHTRTKEKDLRELMYTYRVMDIDAISSDCLVLQNYFTAFNSHLFEKKEDMSQLYDWLDRKPLFRRFLSP